MESLGFGEETVVQKENGPRFWIVGLLLLLSLVVFVGMQMLHEQQMRAEVLRAQTGEHVVEDKPGLARAILARAGYSQKAQTFTGPPQWDEDDVKCLVQHTTRGAKYLLWVADYVGAATGRMLVWRIRPNGAKEWLSIYHRDSTTSPDHTTNGEPQKLFIPCDQMGPPPALPG